MTLDGNDYGPAKIEYDNELESPQVRHVMGDGSVRTRRTGADAEYYTYTYTRIPAAQRSAFKALHDSGASTEITIVDDDSNSYTGIVWTSKPRLRRKAGGFFTCQITYRVVS